MFIFHFFLDTIHLGEWSTLNSENAGFYQYNTAFYIKSIFTHMYGEILKVEHQKSKHKHNLKCELFTICEIIS